MDKEEGHVRGFIKMPLTVGKEIKEIVAIGVTKEHVHGGKKMIPMIKGVLKKDNVNKVIADGPYDSRRNFRFLSDSNIESVKGEKERIYKSKGVYTKEAIRNRAEGGS